MRRVSLKLSVGLAIPLLLLAILNVEVSSKQGIDHKVRIVRLPLYLKLLDFFDRHFNYILLARTITEGSLGDREKALRLFEWTHNNIRMVPEGYPVVDDHVWHIIVRGYGTLGQSADVFSTLCNYAGLKSFYLPAYDREKTKKTLFSYVRLNGIWTVFDPYNGYYFVNARNALASIDEIREGRGSLRTLEGAQIRSKTDIKRFTAELPQVDKMAMGRPNIQSPIRRLLFEIRKHSVKKPAGT